MNKEKKRFKHSGKGIEHTSFDDIESAFNQPATIREIIDAMNALAASDEFDSADRSELASFLYRNLPLLHGAMFLEMIQSTWQEKNHTQAEFEKIIAQCVFVGMQFERRRLRGLEPLIVIGGNARESAKLATKKVEKSMPTKKELAAVFKEVRQILKKETLVAIEVGNRFGVKLTTLYKWKKTLGLK